MYLDVCYATADKRPRVDRGQMYSEDSQHVGVCAERARCTETRHWPMLSSSGGITNRWLLVPLIPYTVKQALLEKSHSNMSILSPGLLKAERPFPPPPFAFYFSFTSSPPWSSWQKTKKHMIHTQLSSDLWISCSIWHNTVKAVVYLKMKNDYLLMSFNTRMAFFFLQNTK